MQNPEVVIQESNIVYGSSLGAGLLADIAYPEGRTNLPVLISVHGGRWIRGTRFDDGLEGRPNNGVINLPEWAEKGFFAMRIDYRLVTCTPAPACFQDVACSIRWVYSVAEKYNIDTSNIFLVGQSAGAHMVSLAATLGPDGFPKLGGHENMKCDFKAVISVSGTYNLLTLDWGSGWCPPGIAWDEARRYASPLSHVTKDSKPILVLHAVNDGSVPIKQADEFVNKLKETGSKHVYHRYEEGGHLKISQEVSGRIIDFINSFRQT
jgi:acetyl esterase/lipase